MEQIIKELAAGAGDHPAPAPQHTTTAPGATTPTAPAATTGQYDHLDFHRLIHPENKTFWEAATEGNKLIVRWGRRGARVQIRLRSFPDETSAGNELAAQEEEQKLKGFVPDHKDQQDQEPR
jgi:predicted DNA-binding WGR domain protein